MLWFSKSAYVLLAASWLERSAPAELVSTERPKVLKSLEEVLGIGESTIQLSLPPSQSPPTVASYTHTHNNYFGQPKHLRKSLVDELLSELDI